MAGNYVWPVDAVSGAPTFSARQGRQLSIAPFVAGATATRPLGARSGVRPGTPTSTVSATSTTWTVNPHAGVIDAEAAAEAGPYTYSFDQAQTGTMTASDGTNPRIDLISVQISDPAESDGTSTPSAVPVYTTGTAAPTPAVPATPARSMAIAQINVPVSGGGSPSVTWVAPYLTAAGGVIPVRNATERNATATALGASAALPVRTWRADATDLRQQEATVDGTTFRYIPQTVGIQTWTPTLTGGASLGAGSATGTYFVLGNVCFWDLEISVGTGAAAGGGTYTWSLPIAPYLQMVLGSGYYNNGAFQGPFICQNNGSSTMRMLIGGGTNNVWSQTYAPIAAGNAASFSGSYLIA